MGNCQCICTYCQLRQLEVINVCNGRRLGTIEDVEFDLNLGNITAILMQRKGRITDLFLREGRRHIRIPWCKIERIGEDTILVHHDEADS